MRLTCLGIARGHRRVFNVASTLLPSFRDDISHRAKNNESSRFISLSKNGIVTVSETAATHRPLFSLRRCGTIGAFRARNILPERRNDRQESEESETRGDGK